MAKKLIKDHDSLSLHEISVFCKYKHLSHMTNHFKKMEGITPMQYKSEVRKNKIKSLIEKTSTKNL